MLPLAGDGAQSGARVAAGPEPVFAVAVPVVGVLVLTGLALAVIQLESFGALIETRYGLILSIKLALVAVCCWRSRR